MHFAIHMQAGVTVVCPVKGLGDRRGAIESYKNDINLNKKKI